MTEFVFGSYRLLVDVERTSAWYAAQTGAGITCGCAGCRNFSAALPQLPNEVTAFFEALGVDVKRPRELCYYSGTERELNGGGWFHLCGEIAEGALPEGAQQVFSEWFDLTEGFSVGFKTGCDLLPESFPRPCFQMELNHRMPWMLEEKNPYML